jgi:formylglycine-generating enzyme required for sulfatase activity
MSETCLFVTVPAVTLPNGVTVPSFQVGQYHCSIGEKGAAVVSAAAVPAVRVDYPGARAACALAGAVLITEQQYLAIAYDISQQDINWTGGKVGQGEVFMGLHLDNITSPVAGDFVPDDENERRWHQLSNGEKVYDFAGHIYSWVFDNVQGDDEGLVAEAFSWDSPSIATAPYPSMENGMGWRPDAGSNWSGYALLRGGCWLDEDNAGVFVLSFDSPDYRGGVVGFRCTK